MHSHRLHRLARLSKGVALIGLGLAEFACASEPPSVNGPNPHDDGARRAAPTTTAVIAPPERGPTDAGPSLEVASARDAATDAAHDPAPIGPGPRTPILNSPPTRPTTPTPTLTPRFPVNTNSAPRPKP